MLNKNKIAEIIRVNHAGEFGAKIIYKGQISALKLKSLLLKTNFDQSLKHSIELIEHMKQQEDVHFDYFDKQISEHKIRPTIMQPIWKVGGFALGFITALINEKAAMCCTTAVEEVIDDHYQEQIKLLKKEGSADFKTKELQERIEKFREEELEHRDLGYQEGAADIKYFAPLSAAIKSMTKFAICVSKKI